MQHVHTTPHYFSNPNHHPQPQTILALDLFSVLHRNISTRSMYLELPVSGRDFFSSIVSSLQSLAFLVLLCQLTWLPFPAVADTRNLSLITSQCKWLLLSCTAGFLLHCYVSVLDFSFLDWVTFSPDSSGLVSAFLDTHLASDLLSVLQLHFFYQLDFLKLHIFIYLQ